MAENDNQWMPATELVKGETVEIEVVYVQGFTIGKSSDGRHGIMVVGSDDPEGQEGMQNLPALSFDEEGLLLFYTALGRVLGLKGD